jgi:hypothetical protein
MTATSSSSTTTAGTYSAVVTGTSGDQTATTTVCVAVGVSTSNCASSSSSANFYILNDPTSGSPTITGESIISGVPTPISGSPWAAPTGPAAMAMAPNGNFLLVSGASGVFSYPISSGVLQTAVTASADQLAAKIAIDQTDSWLVEAIPLTGNAGVQLNAHPISSTNGADATSSRPVATASFSASGASVNQVIISPDNKYVFVALGSGGTLVVPFSSTAPFPSGINNSSYAIGVLNQGGSALSVAVDPSSSPRLLYIGEVLGNSSGTSGGVTALNYSSLSTKDNLTQASGSPIASGGLAPNFILPEAAGNYIYVANGAGASSAGNVSGFAISASGSTYTITTGSTTAAGVQPLGLAEDSTGTFVFAVGSLGNPYFDAYTFDATTTGKLDSEVTSTTSTGSIAIVAAPK